MELSSHQDGILQTEGGDQNMPSIRISREGEYKLPPVNEWQQETNQNNKISTTVHTNNPLMPPPPMVEPTTREGEVWYDSKSEFPSETEQQIKSTQLGETSLFTDVQNTTETITITSETAETMLQPIQPIETAVTLNPMGTTTAKPMTGKKIVL